MKTKYFFLAAIGAMTLASCSNDELVGDNSPTLGQEGDGSIQFTYTMPNATRADIYGAAAADLLGNNFYVMGTKGNGESTEVEPATTPTTNLVFDNYLVHYEENSAGTREDNTANWEYVGIVPGTTAGCTNYVKLSTNNQTIKYWDYSQDSYDFFAFSTGPNAAVSSTTPSANQIGVTKMKYGTNITSGATAYTLYIPTVEDLAETYITDIKKVEQANYGKEVVLKFKNAGAKVRVALYETVPGYSVKEVKFYRVDNATGSDLGSATKYDDAYLIGSEVDGEYSFPTKAQINVKFAKVGADNKAAQDYDIATAELTIPTATYETFKKFDGLNYTGKESASTYEEAGDYYLGRTLPTATFAGSEAASYYQTVFPVSTSYPLTLRVDYTLVSTDGSGEEITVYGAKAVVPATYTKWLPNYAYTYVFKISDNTNGWTDKTATKPGLFPITFDAVVTEATDVTGEQTTITTVATPSITTYQQNHNPNKDGKWITTDEYSIATGKDIYVQVMDNNLKPAVLVGTASKSTLPLLNATQPSATPTYHASLLYEVTGVANATEAMVMDALQNRNANVGNFDADVTGRNGITLEYKDVIDNTVTKIENGVDDNSISVTAGQAAKIDITGLTATKTYAYVYDYSWKATAPATWSAGTSYSNKSEVVVYEVVTPVSASAIGSKAKYYHIDPSDLDGVTPSASAVTVDNAHLYFSKTTNGSGTTTYSYISVSDKIGTTLPKGVVVVAKSDAMIGEVAGSSTPVAGDFYFDKYYNNDGSYAVKIIKIVA